MFHPDRLLEYFQKGIDTLIETGHFENGWDFRRTQAQALQAYKHYLANERLTPAQRLKGYFEIPTGIGKTALFIGIVGAAERAAMDDGQELKIIIVAPKNTLLHQTAGDFKKYAPRLSNQIGLYGDNHKNLSQPITIMTYEAWATLSEAGVIGSHNVDVMISDEAHRGTSENRIASIRDYFNETTAQIAFTATAHFDEEKSVQASHEREIFYKPMPDAVREGELCSYIQTQNHEAEIEIPDDLKEKFQECAAEVRTAYRKKLRQTVWNRTATALFRGGKDERTGDPLSDNKAGFFVEGIVQANELEEMLNADPVLLAKAKELGCEHVGLAIHSGLSPREQNRRHKLYKQGKVMAIIGDEQFKEGSDYPHMKTIFDTKHGSLVDKVQIIGRGARHWLNPAKGNRDEGLTFVDIITYFQGEDDDETEYNRETALRTAIRAKDVLQGDVILNEVPEKEEEFFREPRESSGGLGGVSVHIDGANIKSYTTLESLYELSRNILELRDTYERRHENWTEITDEMRVELNNAIEKSLTGSRKIVKMQGAPEGLSVSKIEHWRSGLAQSALREEWEWVIAALGKADPTITITEEMRAAINSKMEQSGARSTRLLKNANDIPKGLNKGIIGSWRTGAAKVCLQSHWDWVMEAIDQSPFIVITEEMRIDLDNKMKAAGVSNKGILKVDKAPEGLEHHKIERWRSGKIKSAERRHWEWLEEKISQPISIIVTDEMRTEINAELIRTGVGAIKLVKSKDVPDGLTAARIDKCRSGALKAITHTEWNWIVKSYSLFPDKETKPDLEGPSLP